MLPQTLPATSQDNSHLQTQLLPVNTVRGRISVTISGPKPDSNLRSSFRGSCVDDLRTPSSGSQQSPFYLSDSPGSCVLEELLPPDSCVLEELLDREPKNKRIDHVSSANKSLRISLENTILPPPVISTVPMSVEPRVGGKRKQFKDMDKNEIRARNREHQSLSRARFKHKTDNAQKQVTLLELEQKGLVALLKLIT